MAAVLERTHSIENTFYYRMCSQLLTRGSRRNTFDYIENTFYNRIREQILPHREHILQQNREHILLKNVWPAVDSSILVCLSTAPAALATG
jgi:hypothetical protein